MSNVKANGNATPSAHSWVLMKRVVSGKCMFCILRFCRNAKCCSELLAIPISGSFTSDKNIFVSNVHKSSFAVA
jgi:hypothetical protein